MATLILYNTMLKLIAIFLEAIVENICELLATIIRGVVGSQRAQAPLRCPSPNFGNRRPAATGRHLNCRPRHAGAQHPKFRAFAVEGLPEFR